MTNPHVLVLSSVIVYVSIQSAFSISTCPAYCNSAGSYVDTTSCAYPQQYCCGNVTTRFCCSDPGSDITNVYRDQCFCPLSNCMNNNWETIASATTTILLFMLIFACCIYNQIHRHKRCRRARCANSHLPSCCRANAIEDANDEIPTVSSAVREGGINSSGFDPSGPFAFEPPPYDVVIKNPPRYDDVILEEHDMTDPPPPCPYEYIIRTEPGATSGGHGVDRGEVSGVPVAGSDETGSVGADVLLDNPPEYSVVDISTSQQQTSPIIST